MPDSPRHGKAADDLQRSPMDSGDSLATRAPQSEREKKPVIVVPVDFSPHSIKAAQYGMKIARDAHGLLLLVHAVHLNLSPIGPANPAWLKIALGQEAWTKAEPILTSAQAAGITAVCAVEEGSPAAVIANIAQRWQPDVIVLASRKHGFLARLFGQRTVEKVIERVRCPVIVLQSDHHGG